MKIIATGGAGFIGSHLVDKLIELGHKVVILDNLSTGKKENINKKAKFYKIDILSPKIFEIFKKEKPDVVYHFAAQINVRKSVEDPVRSAKVNILGTLNILESCKKYKVRKFIFASSVGVYGEPKFLPITENHPLNPISPYSIEKLAIEKYLQFYQTQGLNFVALRFSNIYGPRQRSDGEGGVVAIFIDRVLRGKRPIIFGNGNQTRDFLYIADAVEAAIFALKAKENSIYNVGTNTETKIKDLLKLIWKILDIKIEPIFKPWRQGEIINSRIDYSKIKKELGWRPKYNLDDGLKEMVCVFS